MTKLICINYNVPVKAFNINSKTELYCIFGNPVRHSLSPVMHNAAFQKIGINAVYLAFQPPSIQAAVQSIRSLDIKGASVTIPFKIDALSVVDDADPLASSIGSLNTLVNKEGKITGYNTDGYGAIMALENKKVQIQNRQILILGNGGSARALAYTMLQNKASVILAGRNLTRINGLTDNLKKEHSQVRSMLINDLDQKLMGDIDIIINTTPVGMSPDVDLLPINDELILRKHVVFDIVYSPLMTRLLNIAEKKGCTIVNGLDMLIFQGAKQFELWTEKSAPIEAMQSAIWSHLNIST